MSNREIAKIFNTLGKIMELHGENPFKTKSYLNAYLTIRKLTQPVTEMPVIELQSMRGVGKAITEKILELKETGELSLLNSYIEKTPVGIVEMLGIKGFGPKKIKVVWEQLDIRTPGELLYACNENRLVELKGFGEKTQTQLAKQLEYFLESRGKFLYGRIIDDALAILNRLQDMIPNAVTDFIGDLDRKMPIVSQLVMLTTADEAELAGRMEEDSDFLITEQGYTFRDIPFLIDFCNEEEFNQIKFENSCSEEFLEAMGEAFGEIILDSDEDDLFDNLEIAFIPSESRENPRILERAQGGELALIKDIDIKGVVHAHSTASDGLNTLPEMVAACRTHNYEYLLISDHSKSAFYAGGLREEEVIQQWKEIDDLNCQMDDFKIFKGIESDILNNGDLDYSDDVLAQFDCVIASIHSNLKMPIEKSMPRIIKAIENPYTRILGHPTGRLLLSREGYPLDHRKVIDACIANDVVIELNANPYRLDIDWKWIDYIIEKDGMISINPDAHSTDGIADIRFGVIAARKGGLMPEYCLNTKNLNDFNSWI